MKRILKRINKKGFTLIEVLGVIVILGLILIVAIPTMSRMIHNNNNQEYSNYDTLVREAAEFYASQVKDKIGTTKNSGCAEVTLDTLITEGHIKEFNDQEVTCTTGSGNIKIRNNKGSIKIKYQLICSRNGTEEYNTGNDNNDTDTCTAYQVLEENNIKMKLDSDDSLVVETPSGSKETYITSGNNYVWYSGKMWRIVSFNNTTETVKIVTENPITSIYYSSSNSTTYSGSDVEIWLNNDFLNSLKDQSTFLSSYNWNATANNDINTNKSNTSSYKKNKIGLINTYEYGRIKSWYGADGTWIMSDGGYITASNSVSTAAVTSIRALRPAIVIASDVLVHSGTGTESDPYIIDNTANAYGNAGEAINTRFSGEYVKLSNKVYRIVSVSDGITKIMYMSSLGNYTYDTDHYNYSSSDLKASLESALSSNSSVMTNGDFCLDTINNDNLTYRSSRCLTAPNNSIKVGVPQIGDLFATKIPGLSSSYWTLNPNDETDATGQAYGSTINIITSSGTTTAATITETYAGVPVFYLDNDVKIQSGTGMPNDPYVIS